ncbi:MAG: hypothetical protein ACXWNL_16525 [Vulcanimicrobiaceae bacterium]
MPTRKKRPSRHIRDLPFLTASEKRKAIRVRRGLFRVAFLFVMMVVEWLLLSSTQRSFHLIVACGVIIVFSVIYLALHKFFDL